MVLHNATNVVLKSTYAYLGGRLQRPCVLDNLQLDFSQRKFRLSVPLCLICVLNK